MTPLPTPPNRQKISETPLTSPPEWQAYDPLNWITDTGATPEAASDILNYQKNPTELPTPSGDFEAQSYIPPAPLMNHEAERGTGPLGIPEFNTFEEGPQVPTFPEFSSGAPDNPSGIPGFMSQGPIGPSPLSPFFSSPPSYMFTPRSDRMRLDDPFL